MSHEIVNERYYDAPIERVWDVISDHQGMHKWLVPGMSIRLEPEGSPAPNGVGAIRVMTRMGYKVREQVVLFEAPNRLNYTLLSGFPIKNHLGQISLVPQGDGTQLSWHITFDAKVPGLGLAMKMIVKRLIGKGLSRLEHLL